MTVLQVFSARSDESVDNLSTIAEGGLEQATKNSSTTLGELESAVDTNGNNDEMIMSTFSDYAASINRNSNESIGMFGYCLFIITSEIVRE